MIKFIKIYGERNSGTNFLKKLLSINIENITILPSSYKYDWKHGFSRFKNFEKTEEILFIFIIRDLESWLKSMFKNPYHYEIKYNNIADFLINKLCIKDLRKEHNVNIDIRENDDLFNLRYNKIKHYLNNCGNLKNFIFVNLEKLQNDNEHFLNFLSDKYLLKIVLPYKKILNHIKTKEENIVNRNYNIILPNNIIENKKNVSLENFVISLKLDYFYKSSIEI